METFEVTQEMREAVLFLAPYAVVKASDRGVPEMKAQLDACRRQIARVGAAGYGHVYREDLKVFVQFADPPASLKAAAALNLLRQLVDA